MPGAKRLSVIVASYNDTRIAGAIHSIRRFDDAGVVKIIVVDGNSKPDIQQLIRGCLEADDRLIAEPDLGIFDALNKGLEACDTEFIGWLGSDDVFSGLIKASAVIGALSKADLFVTNTVVVRDISALPAGNVVRLTHAAPSGHGWVPFGLHNPHYSTFGRATLLRAERFRLDLRGADIDYFLRIFKKRPRVATRNVVATLQGDGGYSTRSWRSMLKTNSELIGVYARHANWLVGPVAVAIKVGYKLLTSGYYKIRRMPASRLLSQPAGS
jgi:glycosyltransferase